MSTRRNEKILKDLVKTRNVLKKKLRSIKIGELDKHEKLKDTFKPITEPLQEFINSTKNNKTNKVLKSEEKQETKNNISMCNEFPQNIKSSTPKKSIEKEEENTFDEHNSVNGEDDDDFYSQSDSTDDFLKKDYPNLSDLENANQLDKIYGPHKNSNNEWKFGSSNIRLYDDKINIGNQIWALTPGLFSLMFHKIPKNYDSTELDIYKDILIKTNAHKRNYKPDGQVKGTKAYKYKHIIKKLFNNKVQSQKSLIPSISSSNETIKNYMGRGLMTLNLNKPNYIYWDDVNELVDRLKLLLASQAAGHSNHNNEIVSIIEELYEANIIE